MSAIRVTNPGEPASFMIIDRPTTAQGQIHLRIRACGLNFADLLMQKGTYQDTPRAPFTLGMEATGEVIGLGRDVHDRRLDDHVMVISRRDGRWYQQDPPGAPIQHKGKAAKVSQIGSAVVSVVRIKSHSPQGNWSLRDFVKDEFKDTRTRGKAALNCLSTCWIAG